MTGCFKDTLGQVSKTGWLAFSFGLALLLGESSKSGFSVLGFVVPHTKILYVAPTALFAMMLWRQLLIRNLAHIVRSSSQRNELNDVVGGTPFLEFMRWKGGSLVEGILLTIFQCIVELVPPVALGLTFQELGHDTLGTICSCMLIGITLWSYATLRHRVYEPLLGPIKTDD